MNNNNNHNKGNCARPSQSQLLQSKLARLNQSKVSAMATPQNAPRRSTAQSMGTRGLQNRSQAASVTKKRKTQVAPRQQHKTQTSYPKNNNTKFYQHTNYRLKKPDFLLASSSLKHIKRNIQLIYWVYYFMAFAGLVFSLSFLIFPQMPLLHKSIDITNSIRVGLFFIACFSMIMYFLFGILTQLFKNHIVSAIILVLSILDLLFRLINIRTFSFGVISTFILLFFAIVLLKNTLKLEQSYRQYLMSGIIA